MLFALPPVAGILVGAICYLLLTGGGSEARARVPVMATIERLAILAGLGIEEVTLTGQSFTDYNEVLDAIDLANVRSFLDLDASAVRARIERLSWVATADLTREYPGRLRIRITERKPFAIWQRGDRDYLIDASGRVLTAIKAGTPLALPRVAGEGAETVAPALLATLSRFPDIARRLEVAEWVAGRRWTLRLSAGVTLHLPADRELLTLSDIAASRRLATLIEQPAQIVDLRAAGRVTVRQAPSAPSLAQAPSPGS
jgi:cell division protein FtsQ